MLCLPSFSRPWLVAALLALALVTIVGVSRCSPPSWGPGVVAREQPRQTPAHRPAWEHEGARITPRAELWVRARMLSVRRYSWGREADVSPVDVALGWGSMSDEAIVDQLEIRQSGRWYHVSWKGPAPLPKRQMMASSANMHLIPANATVAHTLGRLRAGDVLVLEGALVDVLAPDGWSWRTSLSRTDAGGGSCELVWVERARIERAPVD